MRRVPKGEVTSPSKDLKFELTTPLWIFSSPFETLFRGYRGKSGVKLDKVKLRKLAKIFDHREIWAYLTDLQSLAWERLVETVPPTVNLSPEELMEKKVDGSVVSVLLTYRNPDLKDE